MKISARSAFCDHYSLCCWDMVERRYVFLQCTALQDLSFAALDTSITTNSFTNFLTVMNYVCVYVLAPNVLHIVMVIVNMAIVVIVPICMHAL